MSEDAIVREESCACDRTVDPATVDNRAGLPAIGYRVGTHDSFARAMNDDVATKPALRRLATRSRSDPAMALIDAWATTLDVLTFYQERIANEGFLRTATEQRSVFDLAAAIGYRPSPGVAAEARLAFEVEATPGAPEVVKLGKGIKVQSTPGQDETAQTFETVEDLEARSAYNAMPLRRTMPRYTAVGSTRMAIAGVAANVAAGDLILLLTEQRLVTGSGDWDVHRVITAAPDAKNDRTVLTMSAGFGTGSSHSTAAPVAPVIPFVLRAKAAIFGSNAPNWQTLPAETRNDIEKGSATVAEALPLSAKVTAREDGGVIMGFGISDLVTAVSLDWPGLTIYAPSGGNAIDLDASYPRIASQSWAVLVDGGRADLFRIDGVADASRSQYGISGRTTRLTLAGDLSPFASSVRTTVVLAQSEQLELAEDLLTDPVQGSSIPLSARVDGLHRGRLLIVAGKAPRVKVPATVSSLPAIQTPGGALQLKRGESLRVTKPVTPSGSNLTWVLQRDDGATGTLTAPAGTLLADEARPGDPDVAESATVAGTTDAGGVAVLELTAATAHAYDRATTVIRGNVARATHGETKRELLGGGDASIPFQTFELKGAPLTHVKSATPGGSSSTLEIRVDDVAWKERGTFYVADPSDRIFVTERSADGKTAIRFGDGRTGARVPSRAQNVTATYRTGTGEAGNLDPGKLDTLMSRPLGLKGVTNPLPAGGGADAEETDEARANAPRTVLTMDRVVSLLDYEHFAASFSGIGKALAAWVWDGHRRVVFLTAGDSSGAPLVAGSETATTLEHAIHANSDARAPFRLAGYEPLTFTFKAGVFMDPDHTWETVSAAIVKTVREAYSYKACALAQPVFASQLVALIQAVPGVVAVDLDSLSFPGGTTPKHGTLAALGARNDHGDMKPAQLLTIGQAVTAITLEQRA